MKRSRIKPMSDKRIAGIPTRREIRDAVFRRDGGCVVLTKLRDEATALFWPPCYGPLTPHHIVKASALGPYSEDNLVTLCSFHNEYVEMHHGEAQGLGLEKRI